MAATNDRMATTANRNSTALKEAMIPENRYLQRMQVPDLLEDLVPAASVKGGGAAASAGIVFQQQLGAFFGVYLLSERCFDQRLNLGTASPVLLGFETEAPVDDILVRTSDDGYIAIQAKTAVSLSQDLASPFGQTVSQFVNHWISCRDGDGSRGWNRPLDPARDRLVLAVSKHAPATIREDLPAALRSRSLQRTPVLTQAQRRALKSFDSCAVEAWASLTTEKFDPELLDQLARLVTVFMFDPSGSDRALMEERLVASIPEGSQAAVALTALETVIGQMMTERGRADLTSLRQAIMTKGVHLHTTPRYRQDIIALRKHTQSVATALQRHEGIEVKDGDRASIVRECQGAVETAARENSLLIVGEPGAGKSGVLNAFARSLMAQGEDVVELAVDQHSVESLEGLSHDLKLEHGLLDVLEAWDGVGPAWLVIDALDATRGGKAESVFRILIAQVLSRCRRWRVVASIRTFDLRMGQQFRSLFPGTPPDAGRAELGFPNVRHVKIPPWTESEFRELLEQAPTLSAALADAPTRLRALASIPFNTHLLSELIARGVDMVDLKRVSSQVELLKLHWSHRIEGYGMPAERCLRTVVEAMVEARTLRVQKHALDLKEPEMIDTLEHEGVLVPVENGRWVQFRHHILFDFTSAQVLLDSVDIVSGKLRFAKEQARGLMLAPALAFVLQEIWASETRRQSFWTAVANLLADKDGDPVIRSAVGRMGVEYPAEAADTMILAERIVTGDDKAAQAFAILSGALAVRMEDDPETSAQPWVKLIGAVAPNVGSVAGPVRFLLLKLIGSTLDNGLQADLGLAARALLEHGYSLQDPGITVTAAIGFVADTYGTDREQSRRLLSRVFDENRLAEFAWQEVPAVCRKIAVIVDVDPAFGAEIYQRTYAFDVTKDLPTDMSSSQILSLTSNVRQDYGMARYSLGEFIPQFLDEHPSQAIEAIIASVWGYISREHTIPDDFEDCNLDIAGRSVRLREDLSHVWAHDPSGKYGRDAEVLVAKLLERLRASDENTALNLANLLIDNASLAVFWSRLFMASAERNDEMVSLLLPFALTEQFLVMLDTRKDAIDVVAKGYGRLKSEDRQEFERQALSFDFSGSKQPQGAREYFLRRLFTAIGGDNLETEAALRLVADDTNQDAVQNSRPFVVQFQAGNVEPYDGITDPDRELPANADLMAAIDSAKKVLALESSASAPTGLTLNAAHDALSKIETTRTARGTKAELRIYGEGVLAQGCNRIIGARLLSEQADGAATESFLRLLRLATNSADPQVDANTEESFEEFVSWGSPAARVEAAQAVLDLALQRPDLLPRLMPDVDMLLTDPHPAVRMKTGLHLIRLWDLDREGFWQRVKDRLTRETNFGVLEHIIKGVLGRVLHSSPELVESLVLELLKRFPDDRERQTRLRKAVADILTILWITHERHPARSVVEDWIADSVCFHDELAIVLSTMRGAFVAGLVGQKNEADEALRYRALELAAGIVDAASHGLAIHYSGETPNLGGDSDAHELARLLDTACLELYFSTGASNSSGESSRPTNGTELAVFFVEAAPILKRIGDCGTPHTVYYLLQLIEFLLPLDPERAFDLAAHALRSGGARTGFQFESMGIDLVVRLVGIFLADHKEIFESEQRRTELIECLEIFMDAGWPAAQRLLYRLPELIQ